MPPVNVIVFPVTTVRVFEPSDIVKPVPETLELISFIAKRQSFEADDGHNDDLVMSLILFSWCTTQQYFKDLLNMDVRKAMYKEKLEQIEEEMTPFGFIDNGMGDEFEQDADGTLWKNVNNDDDGGFFSW